MSEKKHETGWEIACNWYSLDEITRRIAKNGTAGYSKMPTDIYSPEFAAWLTDQYRLAMAKGVQLGRESSVSASAHDALVEAARAALDHVVEMRDAWMRGALSERDGKGGTRSNRNVDVESALRSALAAAGE